MKSFGSDNYSGVCAEVMAAICSANTHHASSYGNDSYTAEAISLLKETFGDQSTPYFVYNGTAANTVAFKAITRSHQAIICSNISHIATQEVGSVQNAVGCSFITVPHQQGKLTSLQIEEECQRAAFVGIHNNKPKVVSIAQSTECGTVYTLQEIQKIAETCKKNQLYLHMDGCRLANAAVALKQSLKSLTAEAGVDVLSFGGTKNGLLFAEAIIFFRKDLALEFEYIRKQSLQLHSKMRFLSAQFIPYLRDRIWYRNAAHANEMSLLLAAGLSKSNIVSAYPVETNQIFAYFSAETIAATQTIFPYYTWDEKTGLVRLVTSFDTSAEEVTQFLQLIKE